MASKSEASAKKVIHPAGSSHAGRAAAGGRRNLGRSGDRGGKLTDIAQVTALMIVLGGTIGAVMVTTSCSRR